MTLKYNTIQLKILKNTILILLALWPQSSSSSSGCGDSSNCSSSSRRRRSHFPSTNKIWLILPNIFCSVVGHVRSRSYFTVT